MTDGTLDIEFTASVDNAKISAIEVVTAEPQAGTARRVADARRRLRSTVDRHGNSAAHDRDPRQPR
ncbi:MAG: hypothetical protein U5K81_08050 [Trueperaceae bacterium]|nr:hypothetical protein [Trueperaceae bacterium]